MLSLSSLIYIYCQESFSCFCTRNDTEAQIAAEYPVYSQIHQKKHQWQCFGSQKSSSFRAAELFLQLIWLVSPRQGVLKKKSQKNWRGNKTQEAEDH